MKTLKISQIIISLLAAVGQGSLVEGILKNTNGRLVLQCLAKLLEWCEIDGTNDMTISR